MSKFPSIDAEVKINADAGSAVRLVAGSDASITIAGTQGSLPVRVLDAFNSSKEHYAANGDDAFVVFLMIGHPDVSYEAVVRNASFAIVIGDRVVGSGKVLSRVEG